MEAMTSPAGIEALLAQYPKPRPELPPAYESVYVEHYRANRAGRAGLSRVTQRLEAWMHWRVAGGVGGRILEIGAGNLNHVPYHPEAELYDAVEPFRELWEGSPELARVRRMYASLDDVPESERYDAVVSVAVLEHLTDLPSIVARAALLLAEGGSFRAAFPSEGGLLWGLAWRCTTGIEFQLRRGLDYGVLMRHEHVNTAAEILAVLGYFFDSVEIDRFPARSPHLSFYTAAIASRPRLDRCEAFCAERARVGARP